MDLWLVPTCSKCFLASSDDYSSNILVPLQVVKSIAHFLHQGVTKSVESFRTVQCDDSYICLGSLLLYDDVLISRRSCKGETKKIELVSTFLDCYMIYLLDAKRYAANFAA